MEAACADELAVLMQATNKELAENRKVNACLLKQNKEMSELLKSVKSSLVDTPKRGKENQSRKRIVKASLQIKVFSF